MNFEKHKEWLKQILEVITYPIYVVGGALRNIALDKPIKDLDLTVECSEEQLSELSNKIPCDSFAYFSNFGVLQLKKESLEIEITMTRTEQYRSKNRKPIVNPANISDDLARRDFTCNAIAYNLRTEQILDPFGGMNDIASHVLRLIPGNEDRVFKDDPLRILRALRFAQQYELQPDKKLFAQIKEDAQEIKWLSKERICDEFMKMASHNRFHVSCQVMMDTGVLNILFPRIQEMPNSHFCKNTTAKHKNIWKHTLQVIERMEEQSPDPIMRIVALLHDVGKLDTAKEINGIWTFYRHEQVGAEMAKEWLKDLKFSKKDIDRVFNIITMHQLPAQLSEAKDKGLRRFINRAGKYLDDLLTLGYVDFTTQNSAKQQACKSKIISLKTRIQAIQATEDFVNFKLKVNGKEIAEFLSLKEGPEIGAVVNFVTALIMDEIIDNNKKSIMRILEHFKESYYGSKS